MEGYELIARREQTMSLISTVRPAALAPEFLADLREAVARHADWRRTAALVAEVIRRRLPDPEDILTAEQRAGDPARYRDHLLHAEPDGSFSVVGLVWLPGQETLIHDHVTWCAFGVLRGAEREELFTLDATGEHLVRAGQNVNHRGEVSGFAPPGDIHRVRNTGDDIAISLHVYGTDISRVGSSVRRFYELPVLPA